MSGGGIGLIHVDDGEGCVCDGVVRWFGWTTLDSVSSYGGGGGSCYGDVGRWRLSCGSCEFFEFCGFSFCSFWFCVVVGVSVGDTDPKTMMSTILRRSVFFAEGVLSRIRRCDEAGAIR